MNSSHALVIAVGLVVSGQLVHAQELSHYRAYVLESSVDTVVTTIGARATEVSMLHKRPATIQELQWRLPYVSPGNAPVDPVRAVAFTFVDDALYQVLVTYDRERTARGAIRKAIRLDALEAPQREMERRKQELAQASGRSRQDSRDEQGRLSALRRHS